MHSVSERAVLSGCKSTLVERHGIWYELALRGHLIFLVSSCAKQQRERGSNGGMSECEGHKLLWTPKHVSTLRYGYVTLYLLQSVRFRAYTVYYYSSIRS